MVLNGNCRLYVASCPGLPALFSGCQVKLEGLGSLLPSLLRALRPIHACGKPRYEAGPGIVNHTSVQTRNAVLPVIEIYRL